MRIRNALAAFAVAGATIAATPDTMVMWNVDASHTEIGFSVRHFFTPVEGRFDEFEADVAFDPADLASSYVRVQIPVASIDTNNEKRNAHLLSADFFDADAHPTLSFESTGVRATGPNEYVVDGELTIRDVTRQVEMPITLLGIQTLEGDMSEMMGGITEVASFQGGLTIDRRDFGVGTGSWAETAIVGGDVEITVAVETNR